jgi:hypothetical protein
MRAGEPLRGGWVDESALHGVDGSGGGVEADGGGVVAFGAGELPGHPGEQGSGVAVGGVGGVVVGGDPDGGGGGVDDDGGFADDASGEGDGVFDSGGEGERGGGHLVGGDRVVGHGLLLGAAAGCSVPGADLGGGDAAPCWPNGATGSAAFLLGPPTPCAPRPGVALAWREGVEMHGTAFVVLHGRHCYDAQALRSYAAAVLAAAGVMKGAGWLSI